MRCDEIQEHIVELLYGEGGTPPEIKDHILTCPDCSRELENLKETRRQLQTWKDEAPATNLMFVKSRKRAAGGTYVRYAAAAAMALICLLALANTQITWTRDEFSFSTHLFAQPRTERDYYTKEELRELMKRALDDTEFRINETNYLMLQKMMDTVEQDRWADLLLIRSSAVRNRNSN